MTDSLNSTGVATAGPVPQVFLLGLCPLLAAGTTLLSAACMGTIAASALCASAGCLLACRRLVPPAASLVFLFLLTAAWVSVLDLAMQYWSFPLRQELGIYVPLIAANCFLLSTLEERMLREGSGAGLGSVCRAGALVIVWLAAVGGLRELAATGQVLGDAALIGYHPWDATGLSGLAVLRSPAGAFLALGLVAALAQALPARRAPA